MKYFFVINPGARNGRSKSRINYIFYILNETKINYDYKLTETFDDAYNLSLEANKKNYDVIVAVGGDGTINKVLNGFYDDNGKRISNSKMGVIYTGTSPDFCKSFNIPLDFQKSINVLTKANIRKVQLGKVSLMGENIIDHNGKSIDNLDQCETKYFACCTNIGLGAMLARKANGGVRKYLGDFLGTFISLIQTLISYKANSFQIVRDGVSEEIDCLYNMSVGRTIYIASGIKVANNLKDGDGRFYNLIVKNINLFNSPGIISKIYSGKKFVNTESISIEYCNSLEILGNYENPEVEFDGDPVGFLPCKIEIAKDELELITNK